MRQPTAAILAGLFVVGSFTTHFPHVQMTVHICLGPILFESNVVLEKPGYRPQLNDIFSQRLKLMVKASRDLKALYPRVGGHGDVGGDRRAREEERAR